MPPFREPKVSKLRKNGPKQEDFLRKMWEFLKIRLKRVGILSENVLIMLQLIDSNTREKQDKTKTQSHNSDFSQIQTHICDTIPIITVLSDYYLITDVIKEAIYSKVQFSQLCTSLSKQFGCTFTKVRSTNNKVLFTIIDSYI